MYIPPSITAEELVHALAAELPEATDWRTYPACAPRLRFSAMVDGAQVRIHVSRVRHARFIRVGDGKVWIGASVGELRLRITSPNTPSEIYVRLHGALLGVQLDRGLVNPWFYATLDWKTLNLMHKWGHRNRGDRYAGLEALKLRFYGRTDVSGDQHRRLVSMLDDYTKWRRGIRLKERPTKPARDRHPVTGRLIPLLGSRPKRRRRKKVQEKRGPGRPPNPPRPLRREIANMLRWMREPDRPLAKL